MFKELLLFESIRERDFEEKPFANKALQTLASKINKLQLLIPIEDNVYEYRPHTGEMLTIDTNLQTCTFSMYNKLVCKHLVAACMKDNV